MLDNITKRRIDDCRDILVGKLPDPKSQIEQITIGLIYKFMDDMDKEAIELVLKTLVDTIHASIRQEDYLIRWGGEEFIILMKIDTLNSLEKRIEYIRKQIEKQYFDEVANITASFGVTVYRENEAVVESIERADKALYAAKQNGRNRTRIF